MTKDTTSKTPENLRLCHTVGREWKPFPIDLLPDPIRAYVVEGGKAMGTDPVMVAFPLLASVAALIGNKRRISPKPGWVEPPNLYAAIIADPGCVKTPAHTHALKAIRQLQQERFATYRESMKSYEEELQAWNDAKKTERGPKPEKPICEELYVQNTTTESLAEVLENNPRGLLVERDEISGLFDSMNSYKRTGDDEQFFLSAHRSENVKINRKSGDKKIIVVTAASLSIAGGLQTEVFKRVMARTDRQESGMLARFVLAMPPEQERRWADHEIDPESVDEIAGLLGSIMALEMEEPGKPVTLKLDTEARGLFVWFFNQVNEEREGMSNPASRSFLAKTEATALRFALVHHIIREATGDKSLKNALQVDGASMRAGITLAEWVKEEGLRIYETLLGALDIEARADVALFEYLRNEYPEGTTARELSRRKHSQFPTASRAESALERLSDTGLLLKDYQGPGEKGGRPTYTYKPKNKGGDMTQPQKP